jgi:hypothetical protein
MNSTRTSTFRTVGAWLVAAASWGMLQTAHAARLEELTVMALGAVDGRAVVKLADGKMQVLKTGDGIPGTQAVITQVLADRLIVEETTVGADKQPHKQTVWISRPAEPGGRSTVQRLQVEAPPPQPLAAGASSSEQKAAAPGAAPAGSTKKKKN